MEREGDLDGVGAQSSSDEEVHSVDASPEVEPVIEGKPDDETQSVPEGHVSFRDFAQTMRGHVPSAPNFPLANALRVHMKIAHHDNDLRPESEFASELLKLMGENDG